MRFTCSTDDADDSSSDGRCREAVRLLLLRKGHMSSDCRRSAGALPQRPTVTLVLMGPDSGTQRRFSSAKHPCNSAIFPQAAVCLARTRKSLQLGDFGLFGLEQPVPSATDSRATVHKTVRRWQLSCLQNVFGPFTVADNSAGVCY